MASETSPLGDVPPGWSVRRLADVTTKIGSGATPRGGRRAYVEEGTRLIRSQNVHDLRFSWEGLAHITDDAARALSGVTVEAEDVLLNITGASLARCCVVPASVLPARVNQHVAILRTGEQLDARFLGYLMVHPAMKRYITSFNSGASREAVTKSHIESFEIPVPPLAEQRAIAELLRSLDDRVQWAHEVQSLVLDLAAEIWEEARREDPVETTVGAVAEFENRRRVPLSSRERERRPGPYPYHGATGVFGHIDDFIFDGPHVLVGEDGSVVNEDGTAVVQYPWGRFWVNNHAHVLTTKLMSVEQFLLTMRRVNVKGFVTGAAQPKLSMGRLKQVPITMPSAGAIAETEPIISGLMEQYRAVEEEARIAASLRDLLLPELLSGRLKVDRPEQLSEGAV